MAAPNIIIINARSMVKHHDEINVLADKYSNVVDIIIVTETLFREGNEKTINGFDGFFITVIGNQGMEEGLQFI